MLEIIRQRGENKTASVVIVLYKSFVPSNLKYGYHSGHHSSKRILKSWKGFRKGKKIRIIGTSEQLGYKGRLHTAFGAV